MSERPFGSVTRYSSAGLVVNSVIRNTFILLGLSFLFSSATAAFAMFTGAPYLGPFVTLLGFIGLSYLVNALRNSVYGIFAVFALTGFMGYTLGPLLHSIMYTFANGQAIILTALGGTGLIFFGLAGYALTTRKDFSYLGGFLTVGAITIFMAMLIGLFFPMPILSVLISMVMVLLMSGFILFDLSLIINGGERNYIVATVSIFSSLFNLFVSLLNILTVFTGRDD